ncbi:MAG: autotransporter-associated beta strand repeat-containing protein, partial [Verrucomicrobia bacterium]|nr:autotransporter-associated beta strand repeat-containing protein [Verrucomicrobiota bacterium]
MSVAASFRNNHTQRPSNPSVMNTMNAPKTRTPLVRNQSAIRRMALLLVAAAALLSSQVAQAQLTNIYLPWYEPFGYVITNSTTRLAEDAASGSDSWGNGGSSWYLFSSNSLSYPELAAPQGHRVSITGGTANKYSECRPQIDSAYSVSGTNSLYISLMLRVRDTTGIGTTSPGNGIIGACRDSGSGRYGAVHLWNDAGTIKVGAVKYGGNTTVSSSNFFSTGISADNTTTYFIVLKYQYVSGVENDVVTVWVNPDSAYFGGPNEDPANFVTTSAGADGTSSLRRTYLLAGHDVDVDEIRLAKSWADATPSSCAAISIVQPPQAATNGVGGSVTFTVSATGTDPIYQWKRYGTNLVDGGNISGATDSTLVINPLTLADEALGANGYSVVVANTCGSGSSQTAGPVNLDVVNGNNLIWSGGNGATWSPGANWNGDTTAFSDYDNVTFDDTSFNTYVSLLSPVTPTKVIINAAQDYTFDTSGGGSIAGQAVVVKTNTGKLIIGDDNTHWGSTTIKQGTVSISKETGLGANPVLFNPAQLTLDGGALEGTGSFTIDDVNRGVTLGAGGGTIDVPIFSSLTVSIPITGGQLVKTGDGDLTLKRLNSYSGGTIVSNGVLNASIGGLGSGNVTLSAGATLQLSGDQVGYPNDIHATGDCTIRYSSGSSTLYSMVLYGALSGSVGTSIKIQNSSFNPSQNNTVRFYGAFTNEADVILETFGSPVRLAPYNSTVGAQVFKGVISGVGYINSHGAVTLSGANTFNDGTGVSLQLSGGGTSIGIGADSVPTSGGPVVSSPVGMGAIVFNTVGSDVGTSALLAVGGARTIANPLYYNSADNSATLVFGGSNPLTLSGQIELTLPADTHGTNRTWSVVNTALTTLSGVVTDNGLGSGVTKTGSGTLALNNANTYTGATT